MSIFTPARRVLYAPPTGVISVPYVIDPHAGVLPSYSTGYARSPDESKYPELWKGLVGFWPMFLGQTGGKVIDLSGNGNNGTLEGDTHWVPGKFGSALDFDGTGDYVDCGTNLGNIFGNGISNISVSCIFKADTVTANDGLIYIGDFAGTQGEFNINITSSRIYVRIDNGTFIIYKAFTDVASWHHLVATYDGTVLRLYLDGIEIQTGDISTTFNLAGLKVIIGGYYSTAYTLDGQIGNMMIWNRTLPASEIAFLSGNPTALVQLRRRAVMVSVPVEVPPVVGIPILRRRRAG